MVQRAENINWAKKALNFIARLGVSDGYEPWADIMQRSMMYLRALSGAGQIILIKKEDAVTARVIDLDAPAAEGVYVDPAILDNFNGDPLYYHLPADNFKPELVSLLGHSASLVVLPVKQLDISSYILLMWENDFDFNDDFKEFITACCNKISETAKLARTYYSLEELKVRFNAILQTVSQSMVFIDDTAITAG